MSYTNEISPPPKASGAPPKKANGKTRVRSEAKEKGVEVKLVAIEFNSKSLGADRADHTMAVLLILVIQTTFPLPHSTLNPSTTGFLLMPFSLLSFLSSHPPERQTRQQRSENEKG